MSQEFNHSKPKAIKQSELVLEQAVVGIARRIFVPFVRGDASQNEQNQTDNHISCNHVKPNFTRQRREKGEKRRHWFVWSFD